MENKSGEAKVQKVKNWSPVWIFPIVTALIGAWILFYHYSHQGPEVTLITTNAEGIEGEKPASRAAAWTLGSGERDADRRFNPRGNQSPPQLRDAEITAQRFRLLGGETAGRARGSAVLGHCCPGPILNCSRGRKVRCQRSIRYWILRRWPRRMPRGSVFCWKAARRGSCRRAIRCCSAAIAWGRWKPAPSTPRNVVSLISCLSMRPMTAR